MNYYDVYLVNNQNYLGRNVGVEVLVEPYQLAVVGYANLCRCLDSLVKSKGDCTAFITTTGEILCPDRNCKFFDYDFYVAGVPCGHTCVHKIRDVWYWHGNPNLRIECTSAAAYENHVENESKFVFMPRSPEGHLLIDSLKDRLPHYPDDAVMVEFTPPTPFVDTMGLRVHIVLENGEEYVGAVTPDSQLHTHGLVKVWEWERNGGNNEEHFAKYHNPARYNGSEKERLALCAGLVNAITMKVSQNMLGQVAEAYQRMWVTADHLLRDLLNLYGLRAVSVSSGVGVVADGIEYTVNTVSYLNKEPILKWKENGATKTANALEY